MSRDVIQRKRNPDAHRRAARITARLLAGERLTTAQIAKLTDLTYQGAYRLMTNLSVELPIVQICGEWQRISPETTGS